MNPKISIITPSFNQSQYLEETILSVINQNYSSLEFVIIDGGSTDGSLEIIKKYEKYLTYWVSEKDSGQAEAINKGLKKITGEIVSWLNSDDILLPNTIHKVIHQFKHTSAALIYGKTILFGNNRKEIIKETDNIDTHLKYLGGMPFCQPSSFFRRKVIEEQGLLDETFHYGMDCDLFARIALNYDMLAVNHIYSKYRLHSNSKSITSNIHFANEWARVFSAVLRSLHQGKSIIPHMKELMLYVDEDKKYSNVKFFSEPEIKKAFLYFLIYQIHYHYTNLDLVITKRLIEFIKQYDNAFFIENKLQSIMLRLKIFNGSHINFLRKFTR